jgi:capsular exopolysaccharide synthesis family protein
MEIKDLILLMWRKVHFLVLGLVLGAALGIIASIIQTPVYEATAKALVSRTRQQSDSDMLSLSDEQLLAINLQLAISQPVVNDASAKLGSKIDTDNIQVSSIPNTLIIQIKIKDADSQRAADIANYLVEALIQHNEALLSKRYTAFESAISAQIEQVQKQIGDLETQINQVNKLGVQEQLKQVNQQIDQLKTEITALDKEIASFPLSPTPLQLITLSEKQAQVEHLRTLMNLYQQIQTNLTYVGKPGQNGIGPDNPRLSGLQSTLELYQQIYLKLASNREAVRLARMQTKQNVAQIIFAVPPKNPARPMPVLYFLLGGGVGAALAATLILVVDHLDVSLKTAEQAEEKLGTPVFGQVFDVRNSPKGLITLGDPLSVEAESFRALGASLEITGAKKSISALMVANAEPSENRTTVAANLAVVNAQQGKRVILVDGDFRHPYLHSLFGIENQKGLAHVIKKSGDLKNACHRVGEVEGLLLLPSGVEKKDLIRWLDADKWEQTLSELRLLVDLVIVDSPSSEIADTQILASKMDAVLLVVKQGHTRIDAARTTLRRFQVIGVHVIGVVLNSRKQYRKINERFLNWFRIKSGKKNKPGEAEDEISESAVSLS